MMSSQSGAEVRLAADQRDLFHVEVGHLVDEIEGFGRGELVGSIAPRARPAVPARKVAGERDLPHRVDGPMRRVDLPRLAREREATRAGLRLRSDGQALSRTGARELLGALLQRERIGISTGGIAYSRIVPELFAEGKRARCAVGRRILPSWSSISLVVPAHPGTWKTRRRSWSSARACRARASSTSLPRARGWRRWPASASGTGSSWRSPEAGS